jgi:hypothetical protein
MRPKNYQKFIYWVPEDIFQDFKQEYEGKSGKSLYLSQRFPCEILSPSRPIGAALSSGWEDACKRQGSWYRTSDKAGLVLVAATHAVDNLKPYYWGHVSVVPFQPPALPSAQEVQELYADPAYMDRMPAEWPHLSDAEKERFRRFFDSRGMDISLDDVLMHQSANHANFLRPDPLFYVEKNGEKIPYSITPMELTCCACHELFGVLGEDHHHKYVMRCPGMKFVDINPGEFFYVEKLTSE